MDDPRRVAAGFRLGFSGLCFYQSPFSLSEFLGPQVSERFQLNFQETAKFVLDTCVGMLEKSSQAKAQQSMNKRLSTVVATLLFAGLAGQAQNVNVTYSGGTGTGPPLIPNMVDHTGTVLANTDPTLGKTVEIGYFDTVGGYDFTAHLSDVGSLGLHWHQFGTGTSITTFFGVFPGAFSVTEASAVGDTSFNGKQIELWVFKTSNNLTPVLDPNSPNFNVQNGSSEYGLYTGQGNAAWVFPNAGFVGNSTAIDTSQVNLAYYGSINGTSLGLSVVPEPSSLALLGLGLGLCTLFGRRFRQ